MPTMTPNPTGGFRLTVLGCSSAPPHEAWPAAGYLIEWDSTAVLLDVGQGVVRRLQRLMDPTHLSAVVIGHMHADHYLDIVGLRYLFPWGEAAPDALPVHLPPGARDRLDALATAVSERPGFFDAAFDAREYDPDVPAPDRPVQHPLRPRPPLRPGLGGHRGGARREPSRVHRRYRAERRRGRRHARRRSPADRGRAAPAESRRPRARPPHRRRGHRHGGPKRGPLDPPRPLRPGPPCRAPGAVRRGRVVDPAGGRRADDHHRRRRRRRARRALDPAAYPPRAASSAASARDR